MFKNFKIWACVYRFFFYVQFMQFPVLDFGLDHFTSQPFITKFRLKRGIKK